jgi:hypothetical protein
MTFDRCPLRRARSWSSSQPSPLNFFLHNSLSFLQASFLTLRAVMVRPNSLDHRRQQLLTERLGTQHPVAANLLIIGRRPLRPPTLHLQGKLSAAI